MELIAAVAAFFASAVRMATPLALAGLGEMISEKAGVINIGLEAIMLSGAFCGFIATFFTHSLFIGLMAAVGGGVLVSMVHAWFSIHCRADQTITGLALNFTVLGATSFLFLLIFGRITTIPSCDVFGVMNVPFLAQLPVIGSALFQQNIFVYLALILLPLTSFFFRRTEWGVWVHASGEHPGAVDSAGLNLYAIRYMACFVNGVLGGLAGGCLTLAQLGFFMENITAGKGYIALAVVILGRRTPWGVAGAALLIGMADALQLNLQTRGIALPSQSFTMLPYLLAVIVLLFSFNKSQGPAALGIPYERSRR